MGDAGSPKTKRSKLEENKGNGTGAVDDLDVPNDTLAGDKAAAAEQGKNLELPQGQVSIIVHEPIT